MNLTLWKMAWRNLLQGGRRVTIVGIALSVVSGLLVLMLSLSQGMQKNLVDAATTLAAGHVNVAGFYKTSPNALGAPVINGAQKLRKVLENAHPDMISVVDRHRGWAKLISSTEGVWAGLYGVDVQRETHLTERLTKNNDAIGGDLRALKQPNSIALFSSQAERLNVTIGDQVTLRTQTLRGINNTMDVTVVAIFKNIGILSNWSAFISQDTLTKLFQLGRDSTGSFMIYLKDIERAETVMSVLREKLKAEGYKVMDHDPRPFFTKFEVTAGMAWTGQRLDLTVWSDEVTFLMWVLTAVNSLSVTLALIMLIVIAVGLMNTMWIAIRERTSEIGTLRAIGMSRWALMKLFLMEASLLGLVSGVLGVLISWATVELLNHLEIDIPSRAIQSILLSDTLTFSISIGHCLSIALAFSLFSGITAILPALKGARLQPVTAIQRND